jgi:hypothetical protein
MLTMLTFIVDRPSVIPEGDVEKYGLQPGQVKRQASQGGGFIVYVESMHLLHCLVRFSPIVRQILRC